MGIDSVKVMENWQSKKSNESEKKKKRKEKKSNVRNSEGEKAANGCWLKFRVMVCCVPSTSDVDSSLNVSTNTMGSKSAILNSNDQPVGPVSSTTTTSNAESSMSTPMISEELKIYSHLKKFTFIDLNTGKSSRGRWFSRTPALWKLQDRFSEKRVGCCLS